MTMTVQMNLFRLQIDLDELHDKHIDLQTRSMRENLIFTGIPLTQNYATEKIIEKLMYINLKMEPIAEYDRARRLGKEYEVKDKEGRTRYSTKPIAKELKGTLFGISEQFPKEDNDKRKDLWPLFQDARRQKKKAFFKRDRLYLLKDMKYSPQRKPKTKWKPMTNKRGKDMKNRVRVRENMLLDKTAEEPVTDHLRITEEDYQMTQIHVALPMIS